MKLKVVSLAIRAGCLLASIFLFAPPLSAQSNVIIRVLASNLTSGSNQRYETPGLNILRGLKPDIVALQEFNVSNSFGLNTPAAVSNMVATTFGTNFSYFRETGYAIPNGIISRYPIRASGSWLDSDPNINDRGFAWARIDLPGTNDLYVVSVHLKASSGANNATRRAAQAAEIKTLINANFPTNAWVIVAGDMNLYSEAEGAITTFKTFLSDDAVPVDQNNNPNTNTGRNSRYDRVLPSFSLTNLLVPVALPTRTFANGLVFDSRVYTPLTDVPPVLATDSAATQMQHMAVVKDFQITLAATNPPPAPPLLTDFLFSGAQFQFVLTGTVGANYIVQAATDLGASNWVSLRTNVAPFLFVETNALSSPQRFYRGQVAP